MSDFDTRTILAMYEAASVADRVLRGTRRLLKAGVASEPERQVLIAILGQPQRPDAEVALQLGMARPQFSRVIKSLIDNELVSSEQHPRHRSQRLLGLTQMGLARAAELQEQTAAAFDAQFTTLNPRDQEILGSFGSAAYPLVLPPVFESRAIGDFDWGWLLDSGSRIARSEQGWSTEYPAYLARAIATNIEQSSRNGHGWIAMRAGQRVGACLLSIGVDPIRARADDQLTGAIPLLFVEAPSRSMGVGARLLDDCIAQARALTLTTVNIEVGDSQVGLKKLLKKQKFKARHASRELWRYGKKDVWRELYFNTSSK